MSPPPDVTFIVLAYDDAPALPALLAGLDRVLAAAARDHEIVVVDDGSGDDTTAVAGEAARANPRIRLVRHATNRGVGAAFRTGVEAARGGIVGYVDGDGQYDPDDIPSLLAALRDADAVSGVRVRRADAFTRTLVSRVYGAALRTAFGTPLRDVNSGLKAYRRECLAATWPLVSDGPFYDAEVLVKLAAARRRIAEVPVRHLPRRHGRARGATPGSVLRACRGICRADMAPHVRRSAGARVLVASLRLLAGGSGDAVSAAPAP